MYSIPKNIKLPFFSYRQRRAKQDESKPVLDTIWSASQLHRTESETSNGTSSMSCSLPSLPGEACSDTRTKNDEPSDYEPPPGCEEVEAEQARIQSGTCAIL